MLTEAEALQVFMDKDGAYFKYVRVNGEYRFVEYGDPNCDHRALVQEGEHAETAASVKVTLDGLDIDGYSMTLNIGPDDLDYKRLPEVFGQKIVDLDDEFYV